MKGCRHIVLALLGTALVALSCGPRVIPRGKMADIYAEMFLTDQWIRQHPEVSRTADTLLVYEPIFRRYGYDTDDYLRSADYYMREPDRYAKMLRSVSRRLEKELGGVRKQLAREEYLSGLHLDRLRVSDSLLLDIRDIYVGRPRVEVDRDFRIRLSDYSSDTVYEGPRMIVWSDTLLLHKADSLAADSLAVAADSLLLDSLRRSPAVVREVSDSAEVFVGKVPRRLPRPVEQIEKPLEQ